MPIEQNKDGVYLPDKNTKWPKMTPDERSQVYASLKETYGGHLAQLDSETGLAKKDLKDEVEKDLGTTLTHFWHEILWSGEDYRNEFKADDPRLKGRPVSMALLLSFQAITPGVAERIGILGKEKELMFFCLNYLQNAPENKARTSHGNIDFVPKGGTIKIDNQNRYDRWVLRIEDAKGKLLFEGYLFPDL